MASGLYASIAGVVERVNKLVSVRPLKSRYSGEVGDVVIGRILEIGNKRWRVDSNSKQDAALMLSSINLPGGIQRRKSENDELQMRNFFAEGEILSVPLKFFLVFIYLFYFRPKFNLFFKMVEFLSTLVALNMESLLPVNLLPFSLLLFAE